MFGKILNNSLPFFVFLLFSIQVWNTLIKSIVKFTKGKNVVYFFQLACLTLGIQNLHIFFNIQTDSVLDLSLVFDFSAYVFFLIIQLLCFWSLHLSLEGALAFPSVFRKAYKYFSYISLVLFVSTLIFFKYLYLSVQTAPIVDIFFIGNRFSLNVSAISGAQFLVIFLLWLFELVFIMYCLKHGFRATSKKSFDYFLSAFLVQTSFVITKLFSLPPFADVLFLHVIRQFLFYFYLISWSFFLNSTLKTLDSVGYITKEK